MKKFVNNWQNISVIFALISAIAAFVVDDLVTKLLLAPISIYCFANVFDASFYVWSDYIFAVAWCVVVFWFSFRSPLYWYLGSLKGYKLSARSAYGVRYATAHNL